MWLIAQIWLCLAVLMTKRVSKLPAAGAARESRLQHALENTADYLEIIADLIEERGEARLVDIAARLGVTKGTANKKLASLQRSGYIRSERYRSIFLQPEGSRLAAESKKRHLIVLEFLTAAGVPKDVAETDAEGIEHHVSKQTLQAMSKLAKQLKKT